MFQVSNISGKINAILNTLFIYHLFELGCLQRGLCPSEKELEESHELEVGLVGEILSIILFLPTFEQQSAADGEIQVVFRLIRTALEEELWSMIQW